MRKNVGQFDVVDEIDDYDDNDDDDDDVDHKNLISLNYILKK